MDYLKTRWQEMSWGRRFILLIQPILFILFLFIFLALGHQQMISYRGGHLRYEQQGDTAVYSGQAEGRKVKYVVSPGPVVEFWLDGVLDSTYTVTEDPTAIPQTEEAAQFAPGFLTGVEIRRGDQVWYRGAYPAHATSFWLLDEDGWSGLSGSIIITGQAPDPAPTPLNIITMAHGPETSPRGYGPGLLLGLLLGIACAVSVLFEDQLFRWQMSFRIQDPDRAEPSEWELFGRWMGWFVLSGMALFVYVLASGLVIIS